MTTGMPSGAPDLSPEAVERLAAKVYTGREVRKSLHSKDRFVRADDYEKLGAELARVQAEREAMREPLQKIAGADYRSNRSSESQTAFAALAAMKDKP